MIFYAIIGSCGLLTGSKFLIDWAMRLCEPKGMHDVKSCNVCQS